MEGRRVVRNVLIGGDQNVETGRFGCLQETPDFQPRQVGEPGGLAFITRE